jgi:hypothetical protein
MAVNHINDLKGIPRESQTGAVGMRERANAVANDFLARKLKPWTGK